jgi:hypothetical protein
VHFGLGEAPKVDLVKVIDTLKDLVPNRLVVIKEGQGVVDVEKLAGAKKPYLKAGKLVRSSVVPVLAPVYGANEHGPKPSSSGPCPSNVYWTLTETSSRYIYVRSP